MSKHIKRLAVPRSWHIAKKAAVWSIKPRAGPHAVEDSIPLGVVVRDYLKLCDSLTEAKRILSSEQVLVDGKPVTAHNHGVGFMDTVSVPKLEANYRMLVDYHGRLVLQSIPAAAAGWKLCRIEDKTTIAGGKTQLNLHDGRNILVKEQAAHKTGDVLKIKLPDQKVMDHFAFKPGAPVYVTGGSHTGRLATLGERAVTKSPKPNLVDIKVGEEPSSTIQDYVFVVGNAKPEVLAPEVNA